MLQGIAARHPMLASRLGEVPTDDIGLPFWAIALVYPQEYSAQYDLAFGERTRNSMKNRLELAMRFLVARQAAAEPPMAASSEGLPT